MYKTHVSLYGSRGDGSDDCKDDGQEDEATHFQCFSTFFYEVKIIEEVMSDTNQLSYISMKFPHAN